VQRAIKLNAGNPSIGSGNASKSGTFAELEFIPELVEGRHWLNHSLA